MRRSSAGAPSPPPLRGRRFYLDARAPRLERAIRALGGAVELFFAAETVTHVVCDASAEGDNDVVEENEGGGDDEEAAAGRRDSAPEVARVGGYRTRTDAMLESARRAPRSRSLSVLQRARLWNIPVWSVRKTERFLCRVGKAVRDKIGSGARRLKGSFIKFESTDRNNRAVFKEFQEWPTLDLAKDHAASPFVRIDPKAAPRRPPRSEPKTQEDERRRADDRSPRPESRMTRKSGPRLKDRTEDLPKRSGYCEICRTSYSALSEHERTSAHVDFVKNAANFLSLDALINESGDVDAFLKMNKSNGSPCERRSSRKIKVAPREDKPAACNGGRPESAYRSMTLREPKRIDTGHNLRSKGSNALESDSSPKETEPDPLVNGAVGHPPRRHSEKSNGKVESSKARNVRWGKRSSDANGRPSEDRTYYKVVGMSAKLRSSNHNHAQKEEAHAVNPSSSHRPYCNGDAGLVVKFRRVRRSELSVLSNEAENFMFPKKDEDDSTDDEGESSRKPRKSSSGGDASTSSHCKVKEEVLSGDEVSQDSCGSDVSRRRGGRKRARTESQSKDASEPKSEVSNGKRKQRSLSKSPEGVPKSRIDAGNETKAIASALPEEGPSVERCLRWEDGKLKASPEIESLSFAFEHVPSSEPWYDTYKRQDDGRENAHNIAEYLGYYWKSPILPYEMGHLPPLQPNCCPLSQLKKSIDKLPPLKSYGTRGNKKKKTKADGPVASGRKPRKSPREHASTLAILGSLVNKRKSKLSGSDDSKSLPSIAEEDAPNRMPMLFKFPEVQVSEASKKLEEFFSSIVDNEEFDTLVDNLDSSIRFDKVTEKTNVIELLENYERCHIIEDTVKEMQENMKSGDGRKKRRGYKLKKKNNRTGWPAKKKVPSKKETTSTNGSAVSSRETSINREGVAEDTNLATLGGEKSDVCKMDAECSNSDNEASSNSASANAKSWRTDSGGDRLNSEEGEKTQYDLQPVVRVKIIDATVTTIAVGRLRSARSKRRLRGRPAR